MFQSLLPSLTTIYHLFSLRTVQWEEKCDRRNGKDLEGSGHCLL